MKTLVALALAAMIVVGRPAGLHAQELLIKAKQLYESASYSDALSVLKQAVTTSDIVEVEKYRALCFLALGQQRDAEQALEQLAIARPFIALDASEVSPRLVTLYAEVRKRTLPAAAKQMYQRARTTFDEGSYADAAAQFKDVVTLAESAPQEHAELMSELRMLAAGFVRLAETSMKVPEPASPTPAPPSPRSSADAAPAPANRDTSAASNADIIYDATNREVTPPVSVNRVLPPWPRSAAAFRAAAYPGALEVVVGENGTVVAAAMAQTVHPTYDDVLLRATRTWKYTPATVNGRPVKYRLVYPIAVTSQR